MAWSGFRNLKEGPQQGTLFDVRDVPSQPVDSPGMQKRGRRAEMLAAMPETGVFESEPVHGEVLQKIQQRRPQPHRHPEDAYYEATQKAGASVRAEMGRDLADRTSVDPGTLRGLERIHVGQYPDSTTGRMEPDFGPSAVAAHYTSLAGRPAIQAPSKMGLGTLTHEIGHHDSIYHGKNTGEVGVTLRSGSNIDPGEEGRADAFALKHAPEDRGYTYASNARGTEDESKFTGIQSPYRREREAAGQPLREWEGGKPAPTNVGQQFSQLEAFDTERASALDYDVQAYTRDEGREVVGWSPNASPGDPQAIHKHEYPTYAQSQSANPPPFYGANYVSLENADVTPARRAEDPDYGQSVRQTWKS